MEIKDRQVGDVTVLSLNGSIDAITAPEITEFIQAQIAKGNTKLVADLSGVDYTSSAGLRVLLGVKRDGEA